MKNHILGTKNELGVQAPGVIDIQEIHAISPAEAVDMAREDNEKMSAVYRIPDQELLENKEMARGRVLDSSVVIGNLRKLNPKILIMRGGVEGAVQLRYPTTDPHCESGTEYITGFYLEPLPEFSSVTTDAKGLPHREIRGWRSVLMPLITRGIIDRVKADALFGVAIGQRDTLWYRSLQAQEKN